MFKSLKKVFNKNPKTFVAAVAVGLLIAVPSVVMAGFGPDRPTFDYNKYDAADKTCKAASNDHGRCGSMNGPVFNSFVNTPTYGDERNFARISEATPGDTNPNDNNFSETSTATAGKEYWVRTFVHNNANQTTNCFEADLVADANGDLSCKVIRNDAPGIAHNTKVRVDFDKGTANGIDIGAYVSADNANPKEVWDTTTLVNDNQAFNIEYVAGSARLYNRTNQATGYPLADSIVSTGAPVGYDQMNGNLPGCFEYSAYVYVKVKINTPALQVQKFVSNNGGATFQESVSAKLDGTVKWKITYKNTGTVTAKDVTLRDTLPEGVTLVPGSVKIFKGINNTTDGKVVPDSALGGGNVGDVTPGEGGHLEFETKINKDFKKCELKNVAFVRGNDIPEISDDSNVTIENCNTQVTYRCDELVRTLLADRTVRIDNVRYTATGGAKLKTISYNWGDNTPVLVTDKTSGLTHTYQDNNPHIVRATLTFTVNGQDKVAPANEACAKPVDFENCVVKGKEHLPKDSPLCKEVTTLPNTGSGTGTVFGLFTFTTVAGTLAHRFALRRRFDS